MDLDIHRKLIVGFKVPGSLVRAGADIRGCSHRLPFGSGKFCSECGKPAFISRTIRVLSGEVSFITSNGLNVTCFESNEDTPESCPDVCIGLVRENHLSERDLVDTNFLELKEELIQFLKTKEIDALPLLFGVHSAVRYSY